MKCILIIVSILWGSVSVVFSQTTRCDSLLNLINQDKTKKVKMMIYQSNDDINCLSKAGSSPLGIAASRGNLELVKYLLGKGANPNLKQVGEYASGETPIFDAVFIYEQELEPIEIKRNIKRKHYDYKLKDEIVRLLITYGADINMKNDSNDTPLIMASIYGRENIIKLLINEDTNINHQNDLGGTALMYAVYGNYFKIVKILLSLGADKHLKNNKNETAMDIAKKNNNVEIIKLLE